jgi:ABC-2 type transport system ATP-binding protein
MVTGFLGPNGAGKTTTMRMILGLDTLTQGLGNRRRPQLPRPPDEREMALTADHLLVIGKGRLIADTSGPGVRRQVSIR